MSIWNRLRTFPRQLIVGDDEPLSGNEAIFLSQAAHAAHHPQGTKKPEIRYHHSRSELSTSDLRNRKSGSLLARLSQKRSPVTANATSQDYFGTKIIGTPQPSMRGNVTAENPALPTENEILLDRLFGRQIATADTPAMVEKAVPLPISAERKLRKKKRRKARKSDVIITLLGIILGVTCALFPWYIFFNQEKFGVREFIFSGGRATGSAPRQIYAPQNIGKSFASSELPTMELDFFPTATLPSKQATTQPVPVSQQPFPADLVIFTLIHVANGRAMIEDEDGLWVVQRGSLLPDASRVAAIEQRNGRWVLVTSNNKVIELAH